MPDDREQRKQKTWGKRVQERMSAGIIATRKTRDPSLSIEIKKARKKQWLSAETDLYVVKETTTIRKRSANIT
jgi:hypothetical protein